MIRTHNDKLMLFDITKYNTDEIYYKNSMDMNLSMYYKCVKTT